MTLQLSRRTILAGAGASALAGCDLQRGGTHWDLSMPWGPSEFHVANAIRFADEVRRLTEGDVTIHVHPAAILGIKGPETMRAVEEGIVDMADAAGFQQVGTEPILGFESLPYLVDDIDQLGVLYSIIRSDVEAAFARHGTRVVYIVPWPNQNFFFDKPIESVTDFAGMTMRSYDKSSTDLVAGLGMSPIQMPAPDVVPALASGALDAVMTSTTTAVAQKYWEFLRYTVRTNHTWSCNILSINEESWQSLSPEYRSGIEALARRLEPEFWDVARRDDALRLSDLEANGMITQVPSPELLAEMRAQSQPIWRAFLERVPEAEPLLQSFLEVTGKSVQL